MQKNITLYLKLLCILLLFFCGSTQLYAAHIYPGTTLNPGCAPTDEECEVMIIDPYNLHATTTYSGHVTFKSALEIESTTTPTETLGRLYNVGNVLYWSGSTLGAGITSLGGLSGSVQTFATSTNNPLSIYVNSSSNTHTFSLSLGDDYIIPLVASTTEWNIARAWAERATSSVRAMLAGSGSIAYSTTTGTLGFNFGTTNTWTGTNSFATVTAERLSIGTTAQLGATTVEGVLALGELAGSDYVTPITGHGKFYIKPATGGGNDVYTKALLHLDGVDGSTAIIDSSGTQLPFIAYNGALLKTSVVKFGTAALSLNGTTQYIATPAVLDFSVNTQPDTVEVWVYPTSTTGIRPVYHAGLALNDSYYALYLNEGTPVFEFQKDGGAIEVSITSVGGSIPTGVWTHLTFTRTWSDSSYTLMLYVNGVSQGSGTTTLSQGTTGNMVCIGSTACFGGTNYFGGYLDELRFSRGHTRYSANFATQTVPFGSGFFYKLSNGNELEIGAGGGGGNGSTLDTSAFHRTGDAFNTDVSIGIMDSFSLSLITNNTARLIVDAQGTTTITGGVRFSEAAGGLMITNASGTLATTSLSVLTTNAVATTTNTIQTIVNGVMSVATKLVNSLNANFSGNTVTMSVNGETTNFNIAYASTTVDGLLSTTSQSISGAKTFLATTTLSGHVQLSTISGAGLAHCVSPTSKLKYNAITRQFECDLADLPDTAAFLDTSFTNPVNFAAADTEVFDANVNRANITPVSASSTIMVVVSLLGSADDATDAVGVFKVVRAVGTNPTCAGGAVVGRFSTGFNTNTSEYNSGSGVFIDSPGTISDVRYSVCTASGGTNDGNLTEMNISLVILGADIAENYYTKDPTVQAGDIVVFDSAIAAGVKKSTGVEGELLIGVVSTAPAYTIDDGIGRGLGTPVPVALAGRVPVRVSNENGPILEGDRIAVSKIKPGYGRRAFLGEQSVGVALSNMHDEDGTVLVFIRNADKSSDDVVSSELYEGTIADFYMAYKGVKATALPGDMFFSTSTFRGVYYDDLLNRRLKEPGGIHGFIRLKMHENVKLIKAFLAETVISFNGYFEHIFAREVETEKICIGGSCLTEDTARRLVEMAGGNVNGDGEQASSTENSVSTQSSQENVSWESPSSAEQMGTSTPE